MKGNNFSLDDLKSENKNQWCLGCGNFGILQAVKLAILELKLNPKDVLVVSGIGCCSKFPHYLKTFGIESLHGRALPVALGAKLSNPNLHVIVVSGDGDCYGIGVGHFIHSIRRNLNVTYIVCNNQTYALTKGQTSPTTFLNKKTSSAPFGNLDNPIEPLGLALSCGANFIARGFCLDVMHLKSLICEGILSEGFSLIDVAQICVSMNPEYDFKWFKDRIFKIEDLDFYDFENKSFVFDFLKNSDLENKIPIGVFFKKKIDSLSVLPNKNLNLFDEDLDSILIDKILEDFL